MNAVVQIITDNSHIISTPNDIKIFVEYSLGDGDEAIPFHWDVWEDNKKKVQSSRHV